MAIGSFASTPSSGRVSTRVEGNIFEPGVIPDEVTKPSIKKTLHFAKRRLKVVTPKDTGFLASQWAVESPHRRVINRTYYGIFPELGTVKQKAQHFTADTVPEVAAFFDDEVERQIRKLG